MKITTLTKPELKIMLALHREQIEQLEVIEDRQDCNGCTHFQEDKCIKWQVVPPPEVQAIGCEDWLYDADDWDEHDEAVEPAPFKPTAPLPVLYGRDVVKPKVVQKFGFDDMDDDIPF